MSQVCSHFFGLWLIHRIAMCYCCQKLEISTSGADSGADSIMWLNRQIRLDRQICHSQWQRRESAPASALASALSHLLSCSKFSTSDWLRQIRWLKSHPLSHPLSCIRSHLSCDLSEPIRQIYLSIRSLASALSHPLLRIRSHLWWIGRSVTANDREGNPLPHPLSRIHHKSNFSKADR